MEVIPLMLPGKPSGRVVIIGAGKASARMAEAVESVWGPCEGIVITRYGYTRPLNSIKIVEASHPTPDHQGVLGTQEILTLLETLGEDDFVLCLISGGGSSLLCAPAEGLSLSDKQKINRTLLNSGAPIGEMNVVRKHLSKVKGGQLGAASYPSNMLCLIISDVAGDNLSDIASGVTTGENSKAQDAIDIISKYNMDMPKVVETIFSKGDEADSMFIIEYGKVKVEIENPVYLVAGDYFGEMGLLGNVPRNATITAADDSKLLELTKLDLAELAEEHPGLFKELESSALTRSSG